MVERKSLFLSFAKKPGGRQTPRDSHYFFKFLIEHFKRSQLSFLKI